MLLQLGDFPFNIRTADYTQLQRQAQARWARIPLLGASYDALHAVGQENDIIKLIGTVHPQISFHAGGDVGTQAIDTLRDMLHQQEPYLLESGEGENLGYWVILSLVNRDSHYLLGVPRQQQFQITIQFYNETL